MSEQIFDISFGLTAERIAYLIHQLGIDSEVAALDLEMIKQALYNEQIRNHEINAIDPDSAEIEYKRYLHLVKKYAPVQLVPNALMDKMWHHHILDTRAYEKDCLNIFGKFLHHFPYLGTRGENDKKALLDAFENTRSYYRNQFSEEMSSDSPSTCDCETIVE